MGLDQHAKYTRLYNEVKVAMVFIKLRAVGKDLINIIATVLSCITSFYHAKNPFPSTSINVVTTMYVIIIILTTTSALLYL